MGMEGDAADLMARQCIQIAEATAKLAGAGAKHLVTFLYALAKNPHQLQGKTKMKKFIKGCNGAARVFPLQQSDLKRFGQYARKYGLLWAPIKPRDRDGTVDILARAEDVSAVNRIFERMGYAAPTQAQGEEPPKKPASRAPQDRDSGRRGSGSGSLEETATATTSDRPTVHGRLESLRAASGQKRPPVKGPELSR